MDETQPSKNSILFTRLLLILHTTAMQEMGKIADPATGRIVRDLPQAGIAIDSISMLREKCRGNLSAEEERLISHLLSEARLNYVDELNRPAPPAATPTEESEADTPAETTVG